MDTLQRSAQTPRSNLLPLFIWRVATARYVVHCGISARMKSFGNDIGLVIASDPVLLEFVRKDSQLAKLVDCWKTNECPGSPASWSRTLAAPNAATPSDGEKMFNSSAPISVRPPATRGWPSMSVSPEAGLKPGSPAFTAGEVTVK